MGSGPATPSPLRLLLELKITQLPGIHRRPSRYGDGHSFFVAEREIAHFHGDGRMDVRLTSGRIRELKASSVLDSRVQTRGSSAQWATVAVERTTDVEYAVSLVEEAVRANA